MNENNSPTLSPNTADTTNQEVAPPVDSELQHVMETQDRDEQLQQVVDENSPPTEPSVLKRFMKSARDKYDSIPDAWGQMRTNPEERKGDDSTPTK